MLQETWTPKEFAVYLVLVTYCLIATSYEKSDESFTNFTSLVSSLPKAKSPFGETKHSRRSSLDHRYVVGLGDAHRSLAPISHGAGSVPYLLFSV